ncbi:MAG: peptidylprolyl isomerase [Bacteroidales bacterium]|nr:peptidylprolyl isomerase [Bacteroidales bacterium]
MKRTLTIALCFVLGAALLASCGSRKKTAEQTSEDGQVEAAAEVAPAIDSAKVASLPDEPKFDIVTNFGTIRVKLYSDTPKHRANFIKMAMSGFYDGILFHRVINGFMIQCGDPLTKDASQKDKWGTGGPGYTIPAEFVPEHHHIKGALAAARRGDAANPLKESSGSQFYIVQNAAACAALDGEYTVFGETIDGFKVIDDIAAVQVGARDCPVETVKIISVKLVEE